MPRVSRARSDASLEHLLRAVQRISERILSTGIGFDGLALLHEASELETVFNAWHLRAPDADDLEDARARLAALRRRVDAYCARRAKLTGTATRSRRT